MSLKKIIDCIRKGDNFLITSHTSPEGDALGSELAFYLLLKKLGKNAWVVNEDPVPDVYGFLPAKDVIRKFDHNAQKIKFDIFAALDCSDLKRTGDVYRLNTKNAKIINIDHHISNINFGTVNWVEPYASSASEMVYSLYKAMRMPFDSQTALLLYVGMVTDTGSFRYSNTRSSTHLAVAELLKYDIDVVQVYRNTYENIPLEDMMLLNKILPNMKVQFAGRVAWFQVNKKLLKEHIDASFDLSEHLLSFARSIKGIEVVLVFKENFDAKDEVRVNFRSQGKVDVNKVASCFGGGGHKTASGATIHGKIDNVRREVLAEVKANLK